MQSDSATSPNKMEKVAEILRLLRDAEPIMEFHIRDVTEETVGILRLGSHSELFG